MAGSDLLFLAHRIPFPPNKGDKIRSLHILRHLAERRRVHLGCFIDYPEDWAYVDELKRICASTYFEGLNPRWGKIRSLSGFATGQALSLPYYNLPGIRAWVDGLLTQGGVPNIFLYSSQVAQFVLPHLRHGVTAVMDFVDVDSDKWRQYAEDSSGPMAWVYGRESRALLDFERRVAARMTRSLFVSEAEAGLFRRLAPESADRVGALLNGVDSSFFSPDHVFDNPCPGAPYIVFTGAMDYRPNVDAVIWYAREVLPLVQARRPGAGFVIVGGKPAPEVQALEKLPGVRVTGAVPDVRPYVAHAAAAAAPMRMARGIQNKVLEAMAMAKITITTAQGAEGILAQHGRHFLVADTAPELAELSLAALAGDYAGLGAAARKLVADTYSWPAKLAQLDELFGGGSASAVGGHRGAA